MPRPDEFDTTRVMMLADFNAQAHEAYLTAYETYFGDEIHAAYIGKPLGALTLSVAKVLTDPEHRDDPIRGQRLTVRPMSNEDAAFVPAHQTMGSMPEDVHRYYAATAASVSSIPVQKNLDIRSTFPVAGVAADYKAALTDELFKGPTHHVETFWFMEEPTEHGLALGKKFAKESQMYAKARALDIRAKSPDYGRAIMNATGINIGFELEMSSDLPLNGHEPKPWLNAYATQMAINAQTYGAIVERYEAQNGMDAIVADYRNKYDTALAAYNRAEKLLG